MVPFPPLASVIAAGMWRQPNSSGPAIVVRADRASLGENSATDILMPVRNWQENEGRKIEEPQSSFFCPHFPASVCLRELPEFGPYAGELKFLAVKPSLPRSATGTFDHDSHRYFRSNGLHGAGVDQAPAPSPGSEDCGLDQPAAGRAARGVGPSGAGRAVGLAFAGLESGPGRRRVRLRIQLPAAWGIGPGRQTAGRCRCAGRGFQRGLSVERLGRLSALVRGHALRRRAAGWRPLWTARIVRRPDRAGAAGRESRLLSDVGDSGHVAVVEERTGRAGGDHF